MQELITAFLLKKNRFERTFLNSTDNNFMSYLSLEYLHKGYL